MNRFALALLAPMVLASCASAGGLQSESDASTRLFAPGLYEFTASVTGEHTFADGRVQPYTESLRGEVEIVAPTGSVLRGGRPGSDAPVIRSLHESLQLNVSAETLTGTVRVQLPETQRVEGSTVCAQRADGPNGTGPCQLQVPEYHEEVRPVWRTGTVYLTPVALR